MIWQADQLARVRRNQQRCRERKRAHILELESQVEALQEQIRQCAPCASSSPAEHESELDKARRENAARQELLSALGFDDETQQRFIASAADREAVYTILQGNYDRTIASRAPRERLADAGSSRTVDFLDTDTEPLGAATNRPADTPELVVVINTCQLHILANSCSDRRLVVLCRNPGKIASIRSGPVRHHFVACRALQ